MDQDRPTETDRPTDRSTETDRLDRPSHQWINYAETAKNVWTFSSGPGMRGAEPPATRVPSELLAQPSAGSEPPAGMAHFPATQTDATNPQAGLAEGDVPLDEQC
eukprot:1158944-Amphidinium_carterae.1